MLLPQASQDQLKHIAVNSRVPWTVTPVSACLAAAASVCCSLCLPQTKPAVIGQVVWSCPAAAGASIRYQPSGWPCVSIRFAKSEKSSLCLLQKGPLRRDHEQPCATQRHALQKCRTASSIFAMLLAAGCWLLAAGCWLLAAATVLLAAGCWLLAAGLICRQWQQWY